MEKTFNERGVTLTRSGLSAGGQVFALRDIRGVRIATVHRNKVLPLALALAGLAVASAGGIYRSGAALVLGAMLVVVGALAWLTQDVTHQLMVQTDSGEREALVSPDHEFVERVEHAVHAALDSAQPV